jgi:mannose-6-phosphate isomerase-like protein (cupin superfamily)
MFIKNLNSPDEIRVLPKTKIEVVQLGDDTLMKATFQPGWKWSECVKPTAGTDSCEAAHVNYIISGRLMVEMDNGERAEIGPGDAAVIPPGHNAWVVGMNRW